MLGAFHFFMRMSQRKWGKGEVKRLEWIKSPRLWILPLLVLLPLGQVSGQESSGVPEKKEQPASKSELDNLKAEWEAVREQQIQMIREKEEQLEKLEEDIFLKRKAMNAPAAVPAAVAQPALAATPVSVATPVPENSAELETQKAALRAERQKFFSEMARQRESLLKLQASLDAKGKQLEAERQKFELEKKKSVS